MSFNHYKFISCILTLTLTTVANAGTHIVIAPQCLLKNANFNYQTLAKKQDFVLLKTQSIEQLMAAKANHKTLCGGFLDVTEKWNETKSLSANTFLSQETSFPAQRTHKPHSYTIKYETQVSQMYKQMNPQDMWNDLTLLTQFKDRYSESENGVKAAEWIKTQVETIASANHREDVKAYFIETGGSYIQPSLVVKIGDGETGGILVGAHMDTLSSSFENKPGADDDGSGTITALEVARTILGSGLHFNKPIYFVWYSAEEMGLIGSQRVVKNFIKNKIAVDAVMQMDMTGYQYQNDPTMWLIKDYVNQDLTNYVEQLIKFYVKQPVKYTRCGYACSDHASWTKGGFNSSMPFETSFGTDNPDVHTSRDTMNHLSLDHMTHFAQLGIAFITELAEPIV